MNTDVKRIVESKERERRRLAALPFAEKLTLMEQRAAYGSAEKREERHAG
jgi:hypothetical protein